MLQRIVLRAFPNNLLVRKDICPFLVLRVSLRCLIYKVHTANRGGSFIVPQHKPSCQHLFSNFFDFLCRPVLAIPALSLVPLSLASAFADPAQVTPRSGARLYYHPPLPLSTPFFTFLKVFFEFFFSPYICLFPPPVPQDVPALLLTLFSCPTEKAPRAPLHPEQGCPMAPIHIQTAGPQAHPEKPIRPQAK